jgi:hypothetical protein
MVVVAKWEGAFRSIYLYVLFNFNFFFMVVVAIREGAFR